VVGADAAPERKPQAVSPHSLVVEHGEFRDDVACAARVIPQGNVDNGPWALLVSTRGEEVDPRVCAEVMLAAHDPPAPSDLASGGRR